MGFFYAYPFLPDIYNKQSMDYFEIRLEDRYNETNWLKNHRHEFLCKVYERIGYAVENNLDRAKLFEETVGVGALRKSVRKVGIYLKELEGGSYLNTMLKHFEKIEDYEKCKNIKDWTQKINEKTNDN